MRTSLEGVKIEKNWGRIKFGVGVAGSTLLCFKMVFYNFVQRLSPLAFFMKLEDSFERKSTQLVSYLLADSILSYKLLKFAKKKNFKLLGVQSQKFFIRQLILELFRTRFLNKNSSLHSPQAKEINLEGLIWVCVTNLWVNSIV